MRQVFNYIDTDKSGKIKSTELDTVLNRLNIKLSDDAYKQICREADKDGIIFNIILYLDQHSSVIVYF